MISSAPTRVTGGDALVQIDAAIEGLPVITVNGRDLTDDFMPADVAGRFLGLVTGLTLGRNRIQAELGGLLSSLEVTNYPITGPVFAGPKEKPFHCETSGFRLVDGSYLPEAADDSCSINTVVTYVYKPVNGEEFKPVQRLSSLPADVAQTTTTTGDTVPYIVRLETGTIDRGIYQIAVLHDPTSIPEPSAVLETSGWNHRMIYKFGGGCGGMYRQGSRTAGVLEDQFVGQGYAVISNSLNVFAINCDDLLASESMMMTRERAIELLGAPLFTVGWGCSGGSHQVLQIADNYPGLLDGIVALCNSVDFFRLIQHTSDIRLLYDWFETPAAEGLSPAQKQAITGTPLNASAGAAVFLDATRCPDVIPEDAVFHPAKNPRGLRCAQGDHQITSLGRDPETGIARSTLDNVGVQYGLNALQSGIIDVKRFLDLNEQVGGFDRDGQRSPSRSIADPRGVEAAYRSGRVLNAGLGLSDIPIVEIRNYSDHDPSATHLKYGTNVLVARLERENGGRANHVFLLESHRDGPYSASRPGGDALSRYAMDRMDAWLTALAHDNSSGTRQEKVVRTKPADFVDSCFSEDGERIVEPFSDVGGRCNELYPTYLPPRSMAGGPLTNDILKCRLKPVDADDYEVVLAPAEVERLREIFPDGVCDWSRPGVGQVPPDGTWQWF